jgi:hypothetical protein
LHTGALATPCASRQRRRVFLGERLPLVATEELQRMTIQELINTLEQFDPMQDVFVALFKNDGTSELFEIEVIGENNRNVQLEIYEQVT